MSITASVYKKVVFFFTKTEELYWPWSRGYFGIWGRTLVAVAVVERFKQERIYGLSAGTKNVAVVERWPLVEVRLYYRLASVGILGIISILNTVSRVSIAGVESIGK